MLSEPLESELAIQVEYDMDEQGKTDISCCVKDVLNRYQCRSRMVGCGKRREEKRAA